MAKVNFLIIEDNELDYILSKNVIEKYYNADVEIKNVTSLGGAISEIKRDDKNYDIVLLDLNIDDSRGITTLEVFSKECFVPIIINSGISDQDIIDKAMSHGADGYLIKGESTPKEITDVINRSIINREHKNYRNRIINST